MKVRLIKLDADPKDIPASIRQRVLRWYEKHSGYIINVQKIEHDGTFDFEVLDLGLPKNWWVSPHEVEAID